MRTSVVFLAAAVALCSVLPHCSGVPASLVVSKKSAQAASASSSAASSSSEEVVKKAGCGCGGPCGCGGAALYSAKKKSSSAVSAASSSSSSSSYEAKSIDSCTVLTEAQIKVKYARLKDECLDTYYKRILSRSYAWTKTDEAYLKTLYLVRKDFCDLDLWYDRKYIPIVKDYYLSYYAQKKGESLESYYSRLVFRETWETDEIFAKRITIVRDCFPSLDLWLSEKWFDKYTKSVYALEFKKFATETEEQYIARLFERDSIFDTSEEIWAKRLFMIQEATITSCPLWYSDKYVSYFKKFYSIYYKKLEQESYEDWLVRALSPLPGESLDKALTRIKYIKECTGSWGYWKLDYFKKIQSARLLKEDWLLKVQSAFFPSCGCGGAVVVEKSSSSQASAASSASASSTSESSKIVSA